MLIWLPLSLAKRSYSLTLTFSDLPVQYIDDLPVQVVKQEIKLWPRKQCSSNSPPSNFAKAVKYCG